MSKSRHNVTCANDVLWINEAVLVAFIPSKSCERVSVVLEVIAPKPPNKRELYRSPPGFLVLTKHVHMVETKYAGIPEQMGVLIVFMRKQHDVAARGVGVDRIASAANVVCCVVEPHRFVLEDQVLIDDNFEPLAARVRCFLAVIRPRIEPRHNMIEETVT